MLEFTRRDKLFLGLIYGVPIACLGAALLVAFTHAKDWVGRHNAGASWEHWSFAIMIELPALFGILLMTLWPKIGGGRKPLVPRLLFGSAVGLSLYVQQAYAGSDASASARFAAGAPSVLAGIFLELVFWVMGLVEEAKQKAREEFAAEEEARRKAEERPRVGLGDIAPPPLLSPRHEEPVSPPVAPDMSPPTPTLVSAGHVAATAPDTTPHVTPTPRPYDRQTSGVTSAARQGDNAQPSPHVTPSGSPIYVAPPRHPDTDRLEGDTEPDVTPDTGPDVTMPTTTDVTPDTGGGEGDTGADVTPDSQGDMTNPLWAEAAVMRRRGDTVEAIAKHFGKSTRTIQRWKLPEPDSTKPVNGHAVPDLAGADR